MKRLNKYDKYKDSEIEWIGKIPEHWDLTKLKYVTKCLDGRRIPLSAEERGEKQGDIPYWGANGIIDYVNDYLIDEEVVLLGEDGAPFFDKSKDVAFYSNGKIWPNNHIHILQPTKIYIKLLVYLLNAVDYTDYINGSTRDKLTQSDMGNINLLSIPFDEQQAIVNFLDQKTSEIDSLIADKERLIELLQEQRQAIITQAVTKGLDPNVPMKDSGIEWVGEIPEHWEVTKIKYVSRINHHALSEDCDDDFEIQYIDIGGVDSNGQIIEIKKMRFGDAPSRARRIVKDGDTIVSTVRTYLKAITWVEKADDNLICSTGFAVLSPTKLINPQYLLFLMRSTQYIDEIVSRSVGVSYPAINSRDIGKIECLLPPYKEQKYIVDYINKKGKPLTDLIDCINEQILKLKEYRQSLITAAVTGKIDVRDYIVDNDKEEGEEQEEVS